VETTKFSRSGFTLGSPLIRNSWLENVDLTVFEYNVHMNIMGIVDQPQAILDLVRIPILGIIPAGYPSDQEQQSDRCLSIDEETLHLPKNARTFALEVRGDSMINAHIVAGDVVIMELRDPTNRDIVAALIDGETTLKRFLVHKGKPFLRAENSKYPDLIPAHELVIQGVFRALLRVDKRRL
jgi:SOS-response transcriptional repressor LexA